MKTRHMMITSLLITVGLILHTVVPPLFAGIKPDFLLSCMFLAILLNPQKNNSLAAGVLAAIMSALTTGFPGGQIANVVDKLITSMAIYAILSIMRSYRGKNFFLLGIGFFGTLISGLIFLSTASLIADLPASFVSLFTIAVLPTACLNSLTLFVMNRVFLNTKEGKKLIEG